MPDSPPSDVRLLTPSQAAEVLGVSIEDIMALVHSARLRGMRVGTAGAWRIDGASVSTYLDDRIEEARLAALWRQSNEASFPELWGTGIVRHSD